MSELVFKKINYSDSAVFREYLFEDDSQCCDYTCGIVMMWKEVLNLTYAIYDGFLFLKGNFKNRDRFYMPCGKGDIKTAIGYIRDYCNQKEIEMIFTSISPIHIEKLSDFLDFEYEETRDYSDYVYSAQKLATLSGKAFHQKRNHISNFKKNYPDYNFSLITDENIGRVKEFYSDFVSQNPAQSSGEKTERICSEIALNNLKEIGLFGAFIEVDEKIVAFTIGEVKKDALYVHVEKADRNYVGSYPVINNEFVKYCVDKFNVNWVNREDDSGQAGLRKAKLSYHPSHLAVKGKLKAI